MSVELPARPVPPNRCGRTPNQTIPGTTIMRSYTKQHNFRTGKILENLRLDEWNMPRFFAPYELLVAMGITSGFVLPKDIEAASALIGNSVTEIHTLDFGSHLGIGAGVGDSA